MPKKPIPPKKRASSPRVSKKVSVRTMHGGAIVGAVHCADFVAGNQRTTYGFTARDVERLIEKVLQLLQAGATFLPSGDLLYAEHDGETLTFRAGAIQQLAGQRNERSYLLSLTVRRDYQIWATKFIPLAAQMDRQRIVAGLEMPVAYSEFRIPREGEGPDARLMPEPLADITEALAKHQAFVILGEPGAGKTTTLQKIAFESARKLLSGEPGRVPLFVRLSQQANRTPFDFLAVEWQQRTGTDIADALAGGRVLLLADGINELPRDDRDERLKAWRILVEENGQANQIVFTSREKDYDAQLNLPRVRVEPLDDERIADYLKRNDAMGLAEQLADPKARLLEMARNPFNLSLLVHAWKSNQREMANRGRLLEWFVGELFAREERLAHRSWIRREAQILALSQLAYSMQAQGESTTLVLKTARASVPVTVEVNGEEIALKSVDLSRFARAATILDPGTDPDIRFYHHLLQEYFAALELLRRFDVGEDLSALWKCKRLASEMPPSEANEWDPLPQPPATGWEVTTILACGLARDPARLIEAVRPHNPVLAGRMLDEAGIAKPDAVTTRVRADLLADLYNPAMHLRARLQAGFTLGCIGDPRFVPQTINGVKVIVPTMVRVPAGTYIIGDDTSQYDDEKPQHTLELPAFEIAKWSVTNAEYACFIEAGGYKNEHYWKTELAKHWLRGDDVAGGQLTTWLGVWKTLQSTPNWKEKYESSGIYSAQDMRSYEWIASLSESELRAEFGKHAAIKSRERPHYWDDAQLTWPSQPVVGITWFEANAYCVWLSEIIGREFRLPSEVEWEAAARGSEGRAYPWGLQWDSARANTLEGRALKPSPVGAYQAAGGTGPFGTEDHAGNVWNWTSTLFKQYPYQASSQEDPESKGERIVRGGSWDFVCDKARCAHRRKYVPDDFDTYMGFRVFSSNTFLDSVF